MTSARSQKPLKLDRPLRGRIYDSIAETIGNTPLVRVPHLCADEGIEADVCLKLEFLNPIASVKDRIGVSMIEAMEAEGRIGPGATIVEPTSGNTGIGLAFMCAARGYRLILTMPESVSVERRAMLRFLGAEVQLTPRENGMKGAIERARQLLAEIPGSAMPDQFANPANPDIHRRGRDLVRHRWKSGRHRVRHRNGRDAHGLRPSAQAAPADAQDDRRRAGGEPGPLGRTAEPASDSGHRRRLRARYSGPRTDR
jgi:Pyridoxal-phosphate dependent enzyme